jgi:spore coat assembly protein
MSFQVGDLVARKSYDQDMCFRIIAIHHHKGLVELRGVDIRLFADAPFDDLVKIEDGDRNTLIQQEKEIRSNALDKIKEKREQDDTYFEIPGRVLHIDGDANYLRKCLYFYKELSIPVYGIHMEEKEMPERLEGLLNRVKPDILVLTGHDAYIKSKGEKEELNAYRSSAFFREAVKTARQYEKNRDNLIIFAGACQSHFESLIQAGANFASSPERINIHALDPVFIVERACYTPIDKIISLKDIFYYSTKGSAGLGGFDTKGTLRIGKPRIE